MAQPGRISNCSWFTSAFLLATLVTGAALADTPSVGIRDSAEEEVNSATVMLEGYAIQAEPSAADGDAPADVQPADAPVSERPPGDEGRPPDELPVDAPPAVAEPKAPQK